jgi:hypothetical protein
MTSYYLSNIASAKKFADGHPVAAWAAQDQLYTEYDYHFSGEWLEQQVSNANPNLKYPLQYDPCRLPVSLHVSFLYGEVPDGANGLVTPEIEMVRGGRKQETATAEDSARKLSAFLQTVMEENGIRSKQLQWGQDMQVYGGAVLAAYFSPERMRDNTFPFLVTRFHPNDFFPTWAPDDYDTLLEAVIAYGITPVHAKAMGVDIQGPYGVYAETWTNQEYAITVDEESATVWGLPAKGKTLARRIPIFYAPHPPRDGFYGTSLLDHKLKLAGEINDQITSTSDMVSEEAANIPAMLNVREAKLLSIGGARRAIDLGFQQGDRKPEMIFPPARGNSTASATNHTKDLRDLIRGEMFCPPVLFGADDGSQRSAASLALRAIPLISHIREERGFLTSAMAKMCKTLLYQAAAKGEGEISEREAQEARVKINWYPMLPRDVLEEVASVISRVQANILSTETAISMIGDVLDIKSELSRIDIDRTKKFEAKNQQKPGSSGELAGLIGNRSQPTKENTDD